MPSTPEQEAEFMTYLWGHELADLVDAILDGKDVNNRAVLAEVARRLRTTWHNPLRPHVPSEAADIAKLAHRARPRDEPDDYWPDRGINHAYSRG